MKRSWKLKKGNEVLGILTETAVTMPFVDCEFVANPSFTFYQAKFAEELRLLNSDQMDQWEQAYSQIISLGLVLEPNNLDSELISEFTLHIDGEKASFRF